MGRVVKFRTGGCDQSGKTAGLATPRASEGANVYGLSVDVFFMGDGT